MKKHASLRIWDGKKEEAIGPNPNLHMKISD
jgi:hypothetical protein